MLEPYATTRLPGLWRLSHSSDATNVPIRLVNQDPISGACLPSTTYLRYMALTSFSPEDRIESRERGTTYALTRRTFSIIDNTAKQSISCNVTTSSMWPPLSSEIHTTFIYALTRHRRYTCSIYAKNAIRTNKHRLHGIRTIVETH